jgi:hypothetical protein
MTPFEKLAWIATAPGSIGEKMRAMIGEGELALLLVKDALAGTSLAVSPTKVGAALKMNPRSARDKIDNAATSSVGGLS